MLGCPVIVYGAQSSLRDRSVPVMRTRRLKMLFLISSRQLCRVCPTTKDTIHLTRCRVRALTESCQYFCGRSCLKRAEEKGLKEDGFYGAAAALAPPKHQRCFSVRTNRRSSASAGVLSQVSFKG